MSLIKKNLYYIILKRLKNFTYIINLRTQTNKQTNKQANSLYIYKQQQ
jgi:hypothetical protein